ncbi:unnamed protein product [Jaminaea pallidilutea]
MKRLQFADLPQELAAIVLDECAKTNPIAMMAVSKAFHREIERRLYTRIEITSLEQLQKFVAHSSAAHRICPTTALSLSIDIPGVPGASGGYYGDKNAVEDASPENLPDPMQIPWNGDGKERIRSLLPDSQWQEGADSPVWLPVHHQSEDCFSFAPRRASARRLFFVCLAITMCRLISRLDLGLFAVSHPESKSTSRRSQQGRRSGGWKHFEFEFIRRAFGSLGFLEHLRWGPPKDSVGIKGFSIAIVDQVIEPLAWGLSDLWCQGAQDVHGMTNEIWIASWTEEARRDVERRIQSRGDRGHPLKSLELSNVQFDGAFYGETYAGSGQNRLFQYLCRPHPDATLDDMLNENYLGTQAFPRLEQISLTSATNVSATLLATLLIPTHIFGTKSLQLNDVFVGSVWQGRNTLYRVREDLAGCFLDQVVLMDYPIDLPDDMTPQSSSLIQSLPHDEELLSFDGRAQFFHKLKVVPKGIFISSLMGRLFQNLLLSMSTGGGEEVQGAEAPISRRSIAVWARLCSMSYGWIAEEDDERERERMADFRELKSEDSWAAFDAELSEALPAADSPLDVRTAWLQQMAQHFVTLETILEYTEPRARPTRSSQEAQMVSDAKDSIARNLPPLPFSYEWLKERIVAVVHATLTGENWAKEELDHWGIDLSRVHVGELEGGIAGMAPPE